MTDDSSSDDTFEAPGTGAAETPTEPTATEVPTEPVATTTATADATTEVPVTAATTASPERRGGVLVPTWLAVALAALLLLGAGFGVGYAVGNDHDHEDRGAVAPGAGANGRLAPFGPFGQNGDGQGNGSGQNDGRNAPGNRDGNGNGNRANGSGVFLGVAIRDSSDPAGAEVIRVVSRGPAADAGIAAGDVITKVDDTKVTDAASLTTAVHEHRAGDEVTVGYSRDGASRTATVTLSDRSPLVQQ